MIIICKDQDDAEKELGKLKAAFLTEDYKIYDKITFSDEASYYEFNAKTVLELLNLQSQIKCMLSGFNEMPWTGIVAQAKDLEKSFKACAKVVEKAPIVKRQK